MAAPRFLLAAAGPLFAAAWTAPSLRHAAGLGPRAGLPIAAAPTPFTSDSSPNVLSVPPNAADASGAGPPVLDALCAAATHLYKAGVTDPFVARVERALKPLEGILKLRDTKEIHTAQQVMQVLLRFCSNTTLTFFLRAMPPSVTLPAAERHDELIDTALYKLVGGARRRRQALGAGAQAGAPARQDGRYGPHQRRGHS